VSQAKRGIFIKSQLFSNFLEAFGSDFFWFGMGPGGHLFEKLQTAMLNYSPPGRRLMFWHIVELLLFSVSN